MTSLQSYPVARRLGAASRRQGRPSRSRDARVRGRLAAPHKRELGRRVMLLLAILALVAAAVVAGIAAAAGIGARVSEGRPAWLILAAGFELMSALGFVAAFQ